MGMEEAALRAKIQAMKNLLHAKQRADSSSSASHRPRAGGARSYGTAYAYSRPMGAPHHAVVPSRSWPQHRVSNAVTSANKVWVNKDAVSTTGVSPTHRKSPVATLRAHNSVVQWRPNPTLAMRAKQLQMLRLEDGEYAKANGGFSLVRSDVMTAKANAVTSTTKPRSWLAKPVKSTATQRAQATVNRARKTRLKPKAGPLRTDYCVFFNKFGYCNNKNACKFIHDSRRIALCRKFVKGECTDAACRLSHDKNKMPVCVMFLRGSCTRDDCRFLHVKVSGTAQLCEAFLQGYCKDGAACKLKHELPSSRHKRPLGTSNINEPQPRKLAKLSTTGTSNANAASDPENTAPQHQVESAPSSSPSLTSSSSNGDTAPVDTETNNATLSIRPNIRFAPRHQTAFPSLLSMWKKAGST
ncbi:hypothetical protein Poli38472_006034 [Pythium oligandrum]|uniref:C3H1-type domain-containing protein n=1 Tax=Pythium oligandrum TaxID=41045 RepID=A0A8K1FMS5_PYTOL|nr:hypothetical protein Poli38472_006034 [Pythium oligandrum]|eukprot:TMW68566.1 hypothetical protein Poli38472_006034 [Pythium oligandrum]